MDADAAHSPPGLDDGLGKRVEMTGNQLQIEFDASAEAARLQSRLRDHFLSLAEARRVSGLPVFALEHGLSEGEFSLLQRTVQALVVRQSTFRSTPLPLVVYAAEIGYGYDGGEIWSTFVEELPGWTDNSTTRQRVRRYFKAFAHDFSGAVPTGAWARKFSIICWPVTHSVLPKVFQRQLVEILYENRYRLSADVIEDSERLGRFIDGASWRMSDRFRNLAQDHALIGQVATALLTADDEELAGDETLLQSTVRRIVDDLSTERVARTWLREAQAATRTSFKGLRGPRTRGATRGPAERAVDIVDPELRLLRTPDRSWRLMLEVKDLSPLTQRHPDMIDDLTRRRCHVNGAKRVLAPSALLWPGQRIELSEPMLEQPLLRLAGDADRSNGYLSDYCRLPPLPWLFRVRDGEGSVVLGRFVRPGSTYILVTQDNVAPPFAGASFEPESILGLNLLSIDVPSFIADNDIAALRSVGLGIQTAVRLWPAGLANAGWNGTDAASWLEGDQVVVGIDTDRAVGELIVTVDNSAQRVAIESLPTFLALDDLQVGQHRVDIEAFAPGEEEPVASGTTRVVVRPRSLRPETGSLREGLVLLTAPVSPTLTDLLSGDVDLHVLGPSGEAITAQIGLFTRGKEEPLTANHATTKLPLAPDGVRRLISPLLRSDEMRKGLVRCDVAHVSFAHRDLGRVQATIERPFTPLRWVLTHDSAEPTAHLIDNMDGVVPEVDFYPVAHPDRRSRLEYEEGRPLPIPSSGLLVATAGDFSTSVVVSPGTLRGFAEIGAGSTEVNLDRRPPSIDSLRELVRLAALWRASERPDFNASLTARRVLQAVCVEIAAGIGGKYWAGVEHHRFEYGSVDDERMLRSLGASAQQRSTIAKLQNRIPTPEAMKLDDLVSTFSSIVNWADSTPDLADATLGEFCLRIASQPSSVSHLSVDEFDAHARSMIEHPITLRLARYLVLRVDGVVAADLDTEAPYRGFTWT